MFKVCQNFGTKQQDGFNLPETSPHGFREVLTVSDTKSTFSSFPVGAPLPHVKRWSFMSFKRQQGSILSWILKMIILAGRYLQSKRERAASVISFHDSVYFVTVPSGPGCSSSYPAWKPREKRRALIANTYIERLTVSCAQKDTHTPHTCLTHSSLPLP